MVDLIPPWRYFALIHDETFLPDPRVVDALSAELSGSVTGATEQYVDDSVEAHVVAPEPHQAYDDMPDLTLIFENGIT